MNLNPDLANRIRPKLARVWLITVNIVTVYKQTAKQICFFLILNISYYGPPME